MLENRLNSWLLIVLVTLVMLLLTSCTSTSPSTPTPLPTSPPTPLPTPSPIAKADLSRVTLKCDPPDRSDLQPGETASLAIEGQGEFSFNWKVVRGSVNPQNASAVIYTAPDTPGADIVSVEVKSDGNVVTYSCSYNILSTPTPSPTPSDTPLPPPPPPLFQKGIVLPTWWKDHYCKAEFGLAAIQDIAKLGAEWVQLVPTWYQDDRNANEVKPLFADKTTSDECLIRAITAVHNAGLNVMLKPHIDSLDGNYRGEIAPSQPDTWLDSYTQMIFHYADIAREHKVQIFVVGTELKSLSEQAYTDRWRTLISQIRQRYFGQLTYAANWSDYDQIEFWDDLDYISIDAYFPLADQDNPSLGDIQAGWQNYDNRHRVDEIKAFATGLGQPILFTEIGYASQDGAARQPYSYKNSQQPNPELQARLYESALQTFWPEESRFEESDFKGFYWWFWDLQPDPKYEETGYMPKAPALAELQRWYALKPGDIPPPPETTEPPTVTITLTPTSTVTLTPLPPTLTPTPPSQLCDDDPSRFGMCPGTVTWQPEQNDPGTKAVTSVDSSVNEKALFGQYSARLNVNLVGGSSPNAKGEAFIDMRFPPSIPTGYTNPSPYDFTGQTVECWVWVPPEAWGNPTGPNGLRLYLKDEESFDSEYSQWLNLDPRALPNNNWFRVALPVGQGERFGNFDPTHVILLGIQFAANSAFTGSYQGPIYVDGCKW